MTLTLEEAQARLPDVIHNLAPGEEISITENNRTVARIVAPSAEAPRPILGRGKGTIIIQSESNDHLEDFKEYMP